MMKKIVVTSKLRNVGLLLVCLFICQFTIAQPDSNSYTDMPPRFNGGETLLQKYIADNFYNDSGNPIDIIVQFLVSEKGSISQLKVIQGHSPQTDARIIHMVESMPLWQPAMVNGKPTPMHYVLPIHLEANEVETPAQIEIASVTVPAYNEDDTPDEPDREIKEIVASVPQEDVIFQIVEQMPGYPGGEAALMKYLSSNITYPVKAVENGVEGRVVVQFVIRKDGRVSNAKILRSLSPETDAEALRVVRSMPRWSPGKQNGNMVNVYYTLPIIFKLQGKVVEDEE